MSRARPERVAAGRGAWPWLGLLVLTLLVRLPSLLHPGPIDDETVYALVANEIVAGGAPYLDAVERKPPLLFWTYAAVFGAAGSSNWLALHGFALMWTLAIMVGLYRIGASVCDRKAGLAAALLYSVFQAWGTWKNLAFNGEMLMNLPLVWAFAVAIGARRTLLQALTSGVLVGSAFLLKQPALVAGLPLALLLAGQRLGEDAGKARWLASLAALSALGAGILLPIGAAMAVLRAQGVLEQAIYWTVLDHDLPHIFWSRLAAHTAAFSLACLPLLAGTVVALRSGAWQAQPLVRTALLTWLAVSCVGAAAGGRFYPHYYIQILPPLCVLAAPAIVGAWQSRRPWPLHPAWLGLTVLAFAGAHWAELRQRREPSAAARYVGARSTAEDRIFVWGHAPQIYLDAERRPASRYILTFPLTGYVFGPAIHGMDTRDRILPEAWPNLAADLSRHPACYIIDVEVGRDSRYPLARFPAMTARIAREYSFVARFDGADIYRRGQGCQSIAPRPLAARNALAWLKW